MNLHEISLFIFNSSHKSIEESVYKYSKIQVKKTHNRWLFVWLLTCSVMGGVIVGQANYAEIFESEQVIYKKAVDAQFKILNDRIKVLKKVVQIHEYNDEMGVK